MYVHTYCIDFDLLLMMQNIKDKMVFLATLCSPIYVKYVSYCTNKSECYHMLICLYCLSCTNNMVEPILCSDGLLDGDESLPCRKCS